MASTYWKCIDSGIIAEGPGARYLILWSILIQRVSTWMIHTRRNIHGDVRFGHELNQLLVSNTILHIVYRIATATAIFKRTLLCYVLLIHNSRLFSGSIATSSTRESEYVEHRSKPLLSGRLFQWINRIPAYAILMMRAHQFNGISSKMMTARTSNTYRPMCVDVCVCCRYLHATIRTNQCMNNATWCEENSMHSFAVSDTRLIARVPHSLQFHVCSSIFE